MDKEHQSHLEHLKNEIKEEALLFKSRAEVAAEDVAEKLESKIVSIAGALQSGSDHDETDFVKILKNEADRAFRLQTKLLGYVTHVSTASDDYFSEQSKSLERTLRVHLSELQGEYREIGSAITNHETDLSDKIASVAGAINATKVQALNDSQWSTFQEMLDQLHRISSSYRVMHGLALGTERPIAAGMAWNHMRKIEIHEAEIIASVYHIVISRVCAGKPVEPLVDQAIDEWKQSRESSLRYASREMVERVAD